MSTSWRKASGDLRRAPVRTASVVVAIGLGIAGFTAVLASYAILTRELNAGYLATNPASATLRTDRVDATLQGAIAAVDGVGGVEARRVLSGRIKAGPAEWRNLTLFVVHDYGDIRIAKLVPEKGAWPPGPGEILLERDAFQVARAAIGDTVIVRTAHGPETPLRVAGGVHDVGQAQARMENQVYGYITLATLAGLGEEPFLDQLQLLVAEPRFDAEHIRSVTAAVSEVVEGLGHPVRRLDIPPPGKHPHAQIMGLLLLAMASFGLFVLALSGILVVNLLTAQMASQVRQVGMMKAIGASRGQIARIYFTQALLLGLAAIVVAIPVGLWGSRILCRSLAVFLNFDVVSHAVPVWVFLLVGLVGLVVPLLSAAAPVWKGSGIPVREALAESGVGRTHFGTGAFDRLLAGTGGATRPLLLALRNGFRNRTRTALTIVTLAAGGVFFMSALNVRASLIGTLDRLFATKKFDLSVNLGTLVPMAAVERAVARTPGVRRCEGWITTEASIPSRADSAATASHGAVLHAPAATPGAHAGSGAGGERFSVVAVPAPTALLDWDIVEGRGLQPDDSNAIVVNGALAARIPGLHVGDEVMLRMGPSTLPWRVVGLAREPFSPPIAYVSRQHVEQFGGHAGMANSLRLVLDDPDPAGMAAVRTALERNLEQESVRVAGSNSKSESRFGFDQHMLMIYVFLVVMSCILAGVGGLGLVTTMSLAVLERRREMGILRAIGATPAVLAGLVVAEALVIGVASWAAASLVAWPLSKALGDGLVRLMFQSGLDFTFAARGPWIWLGVSVVLGSVASSVPAWQAARRPVREALGHDS